MRIERQNELWAMLPETLQEELRHIYLKENSDYFTDGYKGALRDLFGVPNLIDQAEEKQKEPEYNVGDSVRVVRPYYDGSGREYLTMTGEIVDIQSRHLLIDNGLKKVILPSYMVEPYTSENMRNEDIAENANYNQSKIGNSKFSPVNYYHYRHELAKEFAIAMINCKYCNEGLIASKSVQFANEIVKQLKETEE